MAVSCQPARVGRSTSGEPGVVTVSAREEHRREDGRSRISLPDTSYESYRTARERFFERLRVDAEVRRLEKAWRRPAATPRVG